MQEPKKQYKYGNNLANTESISFLLQCPQCGNALSATVRELNCGNGHSYPIREGIVDLLSEDDRLRFAPFLQQYDTVRTAERWGDGSAEYYRQLPFTDTTGVHTFEWRVKAASYRTLLEQIVIRGAKTVLDAGAGNCWLSHRLASEGFAGAATDIRVDMYDGLAAADRYWNAGALWQRVRTPFERPGFMPGQFDAVVFNASLHYSPNPLSIIAAYLPVLRHNGAMYVVDSPVYRDASSGEKMMRERERDFRTKYGIEMTSSTQSYYFTFDTLDAIAERLHLSLRSYSPAYGLKWRLRPMIASILRRREPASFGVFVFEKG